MDKQESIFWINPYPTTHKDELPSYRYCVIGGYKWGTRTNGRPYCAGKYDKEKDNERN